MSREDMDAMDYVRGVDGNGRHEDWGAEKVMPPAEEDPIPGDMIVDGLVFLMVVQRRRMSSVIVRYLDGNTEMITLTEWRDHYCTCYHLVPAYRPGGVQKFGQKT